MMTLAEPVFMSATFWTIFIGAAATVLGCVVGAWAQNKFNNPKQELRYTWIKNESLLVTSENTPTSLTVSHGASALVKPRIIDFRIVNYGGKAITADSFHGGDPLRVNLDATLIEVLSVKSRPATCPVPTWTNTTTELLIEPSLLKSNQSVTFSVLADGAAENVGFQSTLSDIDDVEDPVLDVQDVIRYLRKRTNKWRQIAWFSLLVGIVASFSASVALVIKADDIELNRNLLCSSGKVEKSIKEDLGCLK